MHFPFAVVLVVVNFLFWGHWPICAKFSGAPVQPFGVVMVAVQSGSALLACLCMGNRFFVALAADSQHPAAALLVFLGGAALAIGDFSAAAAIERLGVAVGGPVCFSCMLICGAVGDFLLESSAHSGLLFGGILGCMCAVVADSQSHPPRQPPKPADDRLRLASADSAVAVATAAGAPELCRAEEMAKHQAEKRRQGSAMPSTAPTGLTLSKEGVEGVEEGGQQPQGPAAVELEEGGKEDGKAPHACCSPSRDAEQLEAQYASARHGGGGGDGGGRDEFRRGMTVAVVGGCIGGMWTVLSTLASYHHPLDPLVLLFYFHLGEAVFIVPVVLCYGRLFGGATSLAGLLQLICGLSRRQAAWTAAAGLCIAVGYLCYFATRGVVPRAVAYAFGCAAGSTGMLYGLLVFAEYAGASRRKKALLLLALGLYPSSIALIALSMS
jgi:hypothetical protein